MFITFYFKVHQPYRLRKYPFFSIGKDESYFDGVVDRYNQTNESIFKKVTDKCYRPATKLIYHLLQKYPDFKVSYSLSGTFLEQAEKYAPDLIELFQALVKTKKVEILGETYYHSLSFLYSFDEFEKQIKMQEDILKKYFNVKPQIFSNTEAAYCDDIGDFVSRLGYKGIITEGADKILQWRSPNFLYHHPQLKDFKLILKNYKLSDDIAFRFSERSWVEYPLTADKFAAWISALDNSGDVVNICMDYETLGEHQWEDTGIFEFFKHLPDKILKNKKISFALPSEIVKNVKPVASLSIPYYITWADTERDLSAWQENDMQKQALKLLFDLETEVLALNNQKILQDWRKLQTSDHFYYMCTKWFADGDVHKYFNPYDNPYEAYLNFRNVLEDFKLRIKPNVKIYIRN
jgi:alpha-amylase